MEVHLSAEKEAQLNSLAAAQGRNADTLAQEVLAGYLEEQERFIEAVKAGEADFENGKYLKNEEVWKRIDRLFPS
jgi:predicted transcriptional regulator